MKLAKILIKSRDEARLLSEDKENIEDQRMYHKKFVEDLFDLDKHVVVKHEKARITPILWDHFPEIGRIGRLTIDYNGDLVYEIVYQ
jgi:hypothetical protein